MLSMRSIFRLILRSLVYGTLALGLCLQPAEAEDAQVGQLYRCTDGQNAIKLTQCSSAAPAVCDVTLYQSGAAQPSVRVPLATANEIIRMCVSGAAGQGQRTSADLSAPDRNGFKVGDTVNAATAGGWYNAVILRTNGDSYLVRFGPSVDVWKAYPTELRRIGPLTEVDKARGLFALHEKVQVNVEGRWLDGEITTEMGMEYQVAVGGNRAAWASAKNLRRVAVAEKPAAPAPGQPPHPGLTSCAGKIEGRYASSEMGNFTIVFRSGKARLKMYGQADEEELECWMSGKSKIILHKPGTDEDVPIEVNDDGSLDTPMGEIKKKSSG